MAKTVFILGAGASAPGKCPLMADFLDVASTVARQHEEVYPHLRAVEEVRSELQQSFVKSSLDIDNLESVFTAIEMGRTIGGFGRLDAARLAAARTSLVTLIVRTIEETQTFRVGMARNEPEVGAPLGLGDVAHVAASLHKSGKAMTAHESPAAIITFNYDVGIDYALHRAGLRVDYCLDGQRQEALGFPLLKLHGSMNWFDGDEDKAPTPFPVVSVKPSSEDSQRGFMHRRIFTQEAPRNDLAKKIPFIVPPTDAKADYRRRMGSVWSSAAGHLRSATSIVVIGYSLPPTDVFFRHFYALSTISAAVLDRFWVIDRGSAARDTYEKMLGGGALRRFQYFGGGLEDNLQLLQSLGAP